MSHHIGAELRHQSEAFEVAPRIYQVRGFDLAQTTFVRGKTGWIVIDPLTTAEPARAALAPGGGAEIPRP